MYLDVEKELFWPNPVVSSATGKKTSVTGDSGVKMTGPYEYVAPSLLAVDTPEGQPGRKHAIPEAVAARMDSTRKPAWDLRSRRSKAFARMVGKDHMWPIDDVWNYHAGGGEFKTIGVFTEALAQPLRQIGQRGRLRHKSQMQTYEGVRAMYEAYSRNKYQATGVIQWMLNNAWPSMIWHLYDYYLRPGGGYFGAKRSMEALHPLYGYDDHSIWVVSSQYEDAEGLKLTTKVYNLDATEKFTQTNTVDAGADSTTKIFALPDISGLSPTYFLVLRLEDSTGKLVGSNFYWLSTKPETLDWAKTTWWMTPTADYADFTALSQLPKVKLKVTDRSERKGKEEITHVVLENPSKSLAFFVRLKVNKGVKGEEILPVVWEDNYVSLMPGEKREVSASYRATELGGTKPAVEISGWNVE